eukprot:COSAG02_NODE_4491_length_5296_cov_107.763299_6_plen_26_part_01
MFGLSSSLQCLGEFKCLVVFAMPTMM